MVERNGFCASSVSRIIVVRNVPSHKDDLKSVLNNFIYLEPKWCTILIYNQHLNLDVDFEFNSDKTIYIPSKAQ